MDKYDKVIVSKLAANARMTAADIADAAHLSRSAVTRRIQALEDRGVIRGFHAALSNEELGWAVEALVTLHAPSNRHQNIVDEVLTHVEVVSVRILSGRSHFLIEAVFRDTSHLRAFLQTIQRLGETETHVVFDHFHSPVSVLERLRRFEQQQGGNDDLSAG